MNPRKRSRTAVRAFAALGASALSASLLGGAAASSSASQEAEEALAAIAPEAVSNAAEDTIATPAEVTAAAGATTVTLPLDPELGITVDTGESTFTIEIPSADTATGSINADSGIVSYDNHDGSATVAVANEDSSTSLHTIIEGPNAPQEYSYDYVGDVRLEQLPDGGIVLVDRSGDLVASIAEPWAKDARGRTVSTRYIVKGSTLTQIVEHDAGSAYPIVADPTTLGSNTFYTKVVQNSGSQGLYISVYPAQIKWNAYSGDTIYANYRAIVPSAYQGNKWRDQLVCHAANVGIWKSPWNLDSWRPDVGYARTVLAGCNP